MKLHEVVEQLENIKRHCESMGDKEDPEDIWGYDIRALEIAITELKKKGE